ncbi:uncharacterized protein METZ01_LOCUS233980, partial [marine metagenome]
MEMSRSEDSSSILGFAVEFAQRHRRIVAAVVYAGVTTASLGVVF